MQSKTETTHARLNGQCLALLHLLVSSNLVLVQLSLAASAWLRLEGRGVDRTACAAGSAFVTTGYWRRSTPIGPFSTNSFHHRDLQLHFSLPSSRLIMDIARKLQRRV